MIAKLRAARPSGARSALEMAAHAGYLTGCKLKGNLMENPAKFISQVRAEVGRITWPTRREVITTTIMVLIMASLASIVFFLVDLGIKSGLAALLGFVGS
jgi:preprotein translocase subunit SecE